LSSEDLIKETLLMGFRYIEGPDTQLFKQRFNHEIEDLIPQTIALWSKRDFFQTGKGLKPSKRGLLFVNGFLRDAFSELEQGTGTGTGQGYCPKNRGITCKMLYIRKLNFCLLSMCVMATRYIH
jgi:Coproporphyrinogen III oxidase and related Fe-S oxidoreductases